MTEEMKLFRIQKQENREKRMVIYADMDEPVHPSYGCTVSIYAGYQKSTQV